MKYISEFKKKLDKIGAKNIYYSVKKPQNNKFPFYYKSKYAFGFNLITNIHNQKTPLKKRILIKFLDNDRFLINNKVVSITNLKDKLIFIYTNKGICPLNLIYKKTTSFKKYFYVLSITKSAINEARDVYTKKMYGKSYREIKKEIRMSGRNDAAKIKIKKEVLNKYPWICIDSIY